MVFCSDIIGKRKMLNEIPGGYILLIVLIINCVVQLINLYLLWKDYKKKNELGRLSRTEE